MIHYFTANVFKNKLQLILH